MQQLRPLYARRGRAHTVADHARIRRAQPEQPALDHACRVDARGARPARRRTRLRPNTDDVQRRRDRRVLLLEDRQGALPLDRARAADQLLEGDLPPHRGAGYQQLRPHILLEQLDRSDNSHHQAVGGRHERRPRYRRGGRAGHTAGRGLDTLLLDLPAGHIQAAVAAERRVDKGGPERTAAHNAQARTPQDTHGDQLQRRRSHIPQVQPQPAGRDLGRGLRGRPRRLAQGREARRRHRSLPHDTQRQPDDAISAAILAGEHAPHRRAVGRGLHRQKFQDADSRSRRLHIARICIRRSGIQGPGDGS